MSMTRREFLASNMALVGAGVVAAALARCGGDPEEQESTPRTGGDCLQSGTTVSIHGNHGHTLTVSKDDVAAGVDKTYDITGSSAHGHSVTLTAVDFAKLAANEGISVVSTVSGHSHTVVVNCA